MSYNTVTVEIDMDSADRITVQNLNNLLECLENDYELRKEDRGMAIFESDKDKDLKILKKHIKSFKTVLKYYVGDL
jgi:hypothetical protein